jgi:hypothetical protein
MGVVEGFDLGILVVVGNDVADDQAACADRSSRSDACPDPTERFR